MPTEVHTSRELVLDRMSLGLSVSTHSRALKLLVFPQEQRNAHCELSTSGGPSGGPWAPSPGGTQPLFRAAATVPLFHTFHTDLVFCLQ